MQTLQALCALDAPSGREEAVREYIIQQLQQSGVPMQMQVDALGNLLVEVIGRKRAVRRVLFAAHMIIDPLKARYTKINYWQDQVLHYLLLLLYLI